MNPSKLLRSKRVLLPKFSPKGIFVSVLVVAVSAKGQLVTGASPTPTVLIPVESRGLARPLTFSSTLSRPDRGLFSPPQVGDALDDSAFSDALFENSFELKKSPDESSPL